MFGTKKAPFLKVMVGAFDRLAERHHEAHG